jgi:hypothetical protein
VHEAACQQRRAQAQADRPGDEHRATRPHHG